MSKETVKIKESQLVDLIDKIVNEAVVNEKKQWLQEQETKKNSLLENKIKSLEKKINEITKK